MSAEYQQIKQIKIYLQYLHWDFLIILADQMSGFIRLGADIFAVCTNQIQYGRTT